MNHRSEGEIAVEVHADVDSPVDAALSGRLRIPSVMVALMALGSILIVGWLMNPDRSEHGAPPATTTAIPVVVAADGFDAAPGAETLRRLFEDVGGWDELEIGEAEGAFDIVTFDPQDPDRLLAAHRSSYGAAENQDRNELWRLTDSGVSQRLWDPATAHDFVHFNRDGTVATWTRAGEDASWSPRHARVVDRSGLLLSETAEPLFAERIAVDGGMVFALTGSDDYYANTDGHLALVADDGDRQVRLDDGRGWDWIEVPVPGVLVAYPAEQGAVTAVWDTRTLERLDDHPLAGRPYRRVAVSGDGSTIVAIREDHAMEHIDAATGAVVTRFGWVDPSGLDRPIALDHEGTVAITVDRSGRVVVWFVGQGRPVATVEADAGATRWLSEDRAALTASVVSHDATRVALRTRSAPGQALRWRLIDTDVESWIARARR